MSKTDIEANVLAVIKKNIEPEKAVKEEREGVSDIYLELDSMEVVMFVVELESAFNTEFPSDIMHSKNFSSLKQIVSTLNEYLS